MTHPEPDHGRQHTDGATPLSRINLPALIALWARIVADIERRAAAVGTPSQVVDALAHQYHDELAVRYEISQRIRSRPTTLETREMLAELDQFFRDATTPTSTCILGEAAAVANGWTPTREWYYWRVPKTPSVDATAP